jgi:ribosomal protein S3
MATAVRSKNREIEIEEQPIPEGWHRAILDMSPEVYEFLERLAEESGKSKVEVIRKALGLYRLALDARREGLVVGAATEEQPLDTEFVGF